jgi:hypothetical protein
VLDEHWLLNSKQGPDWHPRGIMRSENVPGNPRESWPISSDQSCAMRRNTFCFTRMQLCWFNFASKIASSDKNEKQTRKWMTRRCVVRGILRIKRVRKLMTRVGLSVANIDFGPSDSDLDAGRYSSEQLVWVFRDPPNFVNSCSLAKVHPNLDPRKHVNNARDHASKTLSYRCRG